MIIINILKNIIRHPFNKNRKIKSFLIFLKWQLVSRVWDNLLVHQLSQKSRILVKNGLIGVTGNIYTGLFEFEDMMFSLHLLEKGDLFIDIGANVGVYSVLLSGEKNVNSIAFEPIPDTFKILESNVKLNNLENLVSLYNCGLGNEKKVVKFVSDLDVSNHVSPDQNIIGENIITIDILTLDDLSISDPTLIKIDVEGFELEVLKGASKILAAKTLIAIIIELNGSGEKYGVNDTEVHKYLLEFGFHPVSYNPFNRELNSLGNFGNKNTIYIRDRELVISRIANSRKIMVQDRNI
jgi:FkbM family methyltransferase